MDKDVSSTYASNFAHVGGWGVAAAHTAGIMHWDPFNIMLDYIKTNQPQIGIIDWGKTIQRPTKQASLNFEPNASTDPSALIEVQD